MSGPPDHYRDSVRARWAHRHANPETRRMVRVMLRHLRHAIPRERQSKSSSAGTVARGN